jgi:hypothetical protein
MKNRDNSSQKGDITLQIIIIRIFTIFRTYIFIIIDQNLTKINKLFERYLYNKETNLYSSFDFYRTC